MQALVALNTPARASGGNGGYTLQRWHGTLLVMAFGTLFVLSKKLLARHLPRLQMIVLPVHVLSLVALVVSQWARWAQTLATEWRSVRAALLGFCNSGGWPSAGVSALAGMYRPMQTMLAYDCAMHMGASCNLHFFSPPPFFHLVICSMFSKAP